MLSICRLRLLYSMQSYFFVWTLCAACICLMVLVPEFVEITGVSLCRRDVINICEMVKTWLGAVLY